MKHNLIDKRFGKLVVKSLAPKEKWGPKGNSNNQYWICKCDCGNEKIIRGTHLTTDETFSCGCIRKKKRFDSHNWTGVGEISGNMIYSIKAHAAQRDIPFDISGNELWELFLNQNRKCFLTGVELTFQSYSKSTDGTASLDRIDNTKGYVKGNVQWIHKNINKMKSDFDQKQFINYCVMVGEYSKKKAIGVAV